MECKDLTIAYKTTPSYLLKFKKDGLVENITGWTVYFTVKENMNDVDNDAIISKDITDHSDPEIGQSLIELTVADTSIIGNYYYDIKVKDDEGGVFIVLQGRIKFTKTVTTR